MAAGRNYRKTPGFTSTEVAGRIYQDTGAATTRDYLGPISDRLFGPLGLRRHLAARRRWSEDQYQLLRAVMQFAYDHEVAVEGLLAVLGDWDALEALHRQVAAAGDIHGAEQEGRLSA